MLGNILDKITGLAGREFVIGAFFPILLFISANFTTAFILIGQESLLKFWDGLGTLKTPVSVGFFILIIALAYLLAITGSVLKRVAEGVYKPIVIGNRMLKRRGKSFVKTQNKVQDAIDELRYTSEKKKKWTDKLIQARNNASSRVSIPKKCCKQLTEKVKKLKINLPDTGDIEEVSEQLRGIFVKFKPDTDSGLDKLHGDISRLWENALKAAEINYSEILSDAQSRYAFSAGLAAVKPTRLGNIMAASWSYPYTRYGIDAVLMWPRLQSVIKPEYLRIVKDAKTSYDFSISMMFLAIIYIIIWSCAIWLKDFPHFEATRIFPVGGLVATIFFYFATIEAARSFGAIFRSCFDLFRFDLLKALRIQLPMNLRSEKKTWDLLNQLMLFEDSGESGDKAHWYFIHHP